MKRKRKRVNKATVSRKTLIGVVSFLILENKPIKAVEFIMQNRPWGRKKSLRFASGVEQKLTARHLQKQEPDVERIEFNDS